MCECNIKIVLPLLLYLIQYGSGLSRIDPLVDSKVGLIRGLKATDGDYSMFMGIPYANVNTSNPFGLAIPHPGFHEAYEAYDDSAICPQVEEFNNTIVGTLDCLHLNIYVPDTANSRNRLPVLVWIYGGYFSIGFSGRYVYGPRFFMKQDVILVTFNYRLGPYGFMCLDTPDVPGNQGLKDQQLALKWIKANIEAFGGDSDKVTVYGESAGAISVDFHLIYSQEKLFDKVIMHSGVALSPWTIAEPNKSVPLKLSENLGFRTTDTEEALSFLTTVDPYLVIASASKLDLAWKPCVEKKIYDVENFVYEHPVNIKNPSIGNMPILLGYNSHEFLEAYETMTSAEYATLNFFYDNLKEYFNFDDEELIEIEEIARHFYIGDEKISEQEKQGIAEFRSDFFYHHPVVRTIQKHYMTGNRNIYYCVFSYDGERNFVKDRLNITAAGASHADDIGYFFDISYMNKTLTPEDQLIIDRVTTLWANFVKFGNPTPEATELLPVQWPAVTMDSLFYLSIDSELKVGKRHFSSRMTFWDLFYKFNEKAQIGYKENTNQCSK